MDSTMDTSKHIWRVSQLLTDAAVILMKRGAAHDASKLEEPEKSGYDHVGDSLRGLTYGSPEYIEQLKELKDVIAHHYAHNTHHPEHYADGMYGFDLWDLVEMFLDWKAASERHDDGNIYRSIEVNRVRHNIPPMLINIFTNTAQRMGWDK